MVTGAEACGGWRRVGALVAALVNAYGPTETAVIAAMSDSSTRDQPPIGRPIANMQAYVLDKYMQPVAVGVKGELYGAAWVSRVATCGDPN